VRNHNVPIYPALAIPIISKQTFECPDHHVDKLIKMINGTEKVLIVGWRAAEKHFLGLIKSNVTKEITVQAVCGRKEWSAETLTRIENYGIRITGEPFDRGFTEYVKSREAERFFG
jgi:hypothetical protein